MNKERRKALSKLANELRSNLDDIEEIRSALETLRDEEQEYFDAMPESFQSGEKGAAAETAIGAIEEAIQYAEDAVNNLSEAASAAETAAE